MGRFRGNGFGLHDTIGNVWEWCRDGYGDYDTAAAEGDWERQMQGASSRVRVFRGGCFLNAAAEVRSACRIITTPAFRGYALGLRAARVIEPAP